MRAEEAEVYTAAGAIKAVGVKVAQDIGRVICELERLNLVRDMSVQKDAELVEAGLEAFATSPHFVAQWGDDLAAYNLFNAAAKNEIYQTKASMAKLWAAEEAYHNEHWTSKREEMEAAERAMARAS